MATMRAVYGVSAAELAVMPSLELAALLKWAPDDSPLAASIRGGVQFMGWTNDTAFLRKIAYFTNAAVSKKPPKPDPGPEAPKWRGRRVSVSDIVGARRK